MTIHLLAAYGPYPINAIVTLDPGTEAGLIAAKQAQADLSGGVLYVPPETAVPDRQVVARFNRTTGKTELVASDGTVVETGSGQFLSEVPSDAKPASPNVVLPSDCAGALWFPFDEGAGTTVTDRVSGVVGTIVGTQTNVWSSGRDLTLGTDNYVRIVNNSVVDSLFRLDNLNGSILFGIELHIASVTAGTGHMFGYGDNGNNTFGGYSFVLTASKIVSMTSAGIGGTTNATRPFNLHAFIIDKTLIRYGFVLHRLDGEVYVDGYQDGRISRSCRYRALEGAASPTVATAQGFRIGARPSGASGSGANILGAQSPGIRVASFFAMRLNGDQRHKIPGWMRALDANIPYRQFPVLEG